MSILIKGLDMPKNCDACPMFFEYRLCSLTDDHASSIEWKTEEKRMPNCPLIELPDHGDLIDRDAYLDKLRTIEDDGVWMYAAAASVSVMPVIIPAERSEE